MRRIQGPRESATRSIVRSSQIPPLPIQLVVGGNGTQRFSLRGGSCVLGAGSEADVLVEGDTISRAHARLTLVPEGVLVEDLNSRNGTFYLGQRVQSMIVSAGATILLGKTEVRLEADSAALSVPGSGPDHYGELVTAAGAMRRLFAMLQRLEGSLASVLVEGESGTGKELIARAIHEHSTVAAGPLIAVNCGALQENLVRSELFGHRKGAFTGAITEHRGAFQAAHGGTLFLDEIGDLPPDVQPMLLRALEERAVVPLGGTAPIPVSVRVVTATHRSLEEAVRAGTFRQDLYYRLVVVRLEVPSLRERTEDIPLLAQYFAQKAGVTELPADVMSALLEHSWPGNVRELRHAIESYLAVGQLPSTMRRAALSDSELEEILGAGIDLERPYQELKDELLERFTRAYLSRLMARCGQNVSQASRLSGIERSYLNKLAHKHGLKP